MNRSGFALILILFIAAGVLAIGAYLYSSGHSPSQVACTQEAKQCSDGSFVGRTEPNCEFAECSITKSPVKPNEIYWSDVVTLIWQCKVKNLYEGRWHSGTSYLMNFYPATDTKTIVDSPGFEAMKQVADAAISTCGTITVGRVIE